MPKATKTGAAAPPTQIRDSTHNLIINKPELARELRLSPRSIDNMMAQRIIPFIRVTKRSVRFYLPRVLAALEKREVREGGR